MRRNNKDSMIRDVSSKNIQNISLEIKRGHSEQWMRVGGDSS